MNRSRAPWGATFAVVAFGLVVVLVVAKVSGALGLGALGPTFSALRRLAAMFNNGTSGVDEQGPPDEGMSTSGGAGQ